MPPPLFGYGHIFIVIQIKPYHRKHTFSPTLTIKPSTIHPQQQKPNSTRTSGWVWFGSRTNIDTEPSPFPTNGHHHCGTISTSRPTFISHAKTDIHAFTGHQSATFTSSETVHPSWINERTDRLRSSSRAPSLIHRTSSLVVGLSMNCRCLTLWKGLCGFCCVSGGDCVVWSGGRCVLFVV